MKKLTLIIPAYSAGPNLIRTIESCRSICDDVVIISTSPFADDHDEFKRLANHVVFLPWNFVFDHGFGELHNKGLIHAQNDWMLLLGVGETYAEGTLLERIQNAPEDTMFRCNHENDPNTWKRVWNKRSPVSWSGLIHEELVGGVMGDVVFRMQDTEKLPHEKASRNQYNRWIKALLYNDLYQELGEFPQYLGGTNVGWLDFIRGARGSIDAFCKEHEELLTFCHNGDISSFLGALSRMEEASGVNFSPQGQPESAGNIVQQGEAEGWAHELPTEPGEYQLRCAESAFQPFDVSIERDDDSGLELRTESITCPLSWVKYASMQWRKLA